MLHLREEESSISIRYRIKNVGLTVIDAVVGGDESSDGRAVLGASDRAERGGIHDGEGRVGWLRSNRGREGSEGEEDGCDGVHAVASVGRWDRVV